MLIDRITPFVVIRIGSCTSLRFGGTVSSLYRYCSIGNAYFFTKYRALTSRLLGSRDDGGFDRGWGKRERTKSNREDDSPSLRYKVYLSRCRLSFAVKEHPNH
jgi:hypothetical protein